MNINPNIPVFGYTSGHSETAGIDIRTYIATQVLNGLISHYGGSNPDSNAKMAIENTDALIKRLNEEE